MNRTEKIIIALVVLVCVVSMAVLGGAAYFYWWQRRVTFAPVEVVTSKVTIGKKTFGTQYDNAAAEDSPLLFFIPADRADSFSLGRFKKASEGKQGYGVRFGHNSDITIIPMRGVIFVDINAKGCTNLGYKWDKKFLESKQDVGNLLRSTGALD